MSIPIPLFALTSRPRLAQPLSLPVGISTSVTWGETDRYRLSLTWRRAEGPLPVVIGLNPSVASDTVADRTLLRLIRDFCPGGFTMCNLFALRATDPADLLMSSDPIGVGNDATLLELVKTRPMVIAAWGAPPSGPIAIRRLVDRRADEVRAMLYEHARDRLHVLDLTRDGHPRHPLYLRGHVVPRRWAP